MASFAADETDRLDWQLLQNGAVTLYWRRELFDRDISWLRDHGYSVHVIDCADIARFYAQMTRVLRFKENYGYEPWTGNLNALSDAFSDLNFDSVTGVAFCFTRIDLLAAADRDLARTTLDIVESQSRDYLLSGHRFLAFAQTDDPAIEFGSIGARRANWNRSEWLNANRGL